MSNETDVYAGNQGAVIKVGTFTDDSGNEIQLVALVGAASSGSGFSIDSADSDQAVASSNNMRRGLTLTNTDSVRVYLNWWNPASSSSWAFFLEPGERWEMGEPNLAELHACWAAGCGTPKQGFEDVGAKLVCYELQI